jgi:hypothetical protein
MPEMSAELRAERRVREDVFVTEFDRLICRVVRCREWNQATTPLCQECDELRLGVPWLCLGVAGVRAGKRCKWLI